MVRTLCHYERRGRVIPPEGDGGNFLPSTSLKKFDGRFGGRPLASLSALVCEGIGRETTSPMQSAMMNRKNLKFMIYEMGGTTDLAPNVPL